MVNLVAKISKLYKIQEVFEKYNIFKATYKSTLRILRCNPWFGLGGHDPVEKIKGEN